MVKHYHGDDSDLKLLHRRGVAEAFEGMTVDDYAAQVEAFFAEAEHPTLGRPYRDCAYVPMVELLRYLEANGFSDLHRLGRRPRLHARDRRARSTGSRPSG